MVQYMYVLTRILKLTIGQSRCLGPGRSSCTHGQQAAGAISRTRISTSDHAHDGAAEQRHDSDSLSCEMAWQRAGGVRKAATNNSI